MFAVATALLYAPLWGEDLAGVVPALEQPPFEAQATEWDRRFAVWLVARNAQAWIHHPWRLFDTGTCHPVEGSLALGHPALSVGLLGVPGEIASGDPIVTYNVALILQTLLSALAMYLLVASWTRDRAAGIAAGLAYAFLPAKAGLVAYAFHGDTAWTVFALYFARRMFAGGGWRDAFGLAAATSLQMAASFYTFMAALCVGLPAAVWLAYAEGRAKLRPWPVALAGLIVALVAWAVFTPFLENRGTSLAGRSVQIFASLEIVWIQLSASPAIVLLATLGLSLPGRLTAAGLPSSPRWALAAGAVAAGLLATSSAVYAGLASLLPGLDTVRVPLLLLGGLHVAWCALAGLGFAGLTRSLVGTRRLLAGAALVAVVFVDTLRPPFSGLPARGAYTVVSVRPPAEEIAFFAELARRGSRGPLLEAPVDYRVARHGMEAASRSVLLHAYHRRRTSACYNSFVPEQVRALAPLAARLPEPAALSALTGLGFTTLVIRGPLRGPHRAWRQRIAEAADAGLGLVPILSRADVAAYTLRPATP